MSEAEIAIGRTLGSSAFFIYQTLKHSPKMSAKDLEEQTGMTYRQITTLLKNMMESGIVSRERENIGYASSFVYSPKLQ